MSETEWIHKLERSRTEKLGHRASSHSAESRGKQRHRQENQMPQVEVAKGVRHLEIEKQ